MSFLSGGGSGERRPGIFDSFRGAFAPQQLPEDDGKPIVAPRSIFVASALSMVAGLVLITLGVLYVTQFDSGWQRQVDNYRATVATCTQDYGGVGTSAVIPQGADEATTQLGQSCQQTEVLSDAQINERRDANWNFLRVFSAVVAIIGAFVAVCGWFLRGGARWPRIGILGSVVVTLGAIMLLSVNDILLLGASLLLVVAVMLSFVGRGGLFFARHRARRAAS